MDDEPIKKLNQNTNKSIQILKKLKKNLPNLQDLNHKNDSDSETENDTLLNTIITLQYSSLKDIIQLNEKYTQIKLELEQLKGQTESFLDIYDACYDKNLISVKLWIQTLNHQVDEPNPKSLFKETLLHDACKNGSIEIVEYLASKNANIEAKDVNRDTPLHYACRYGHFNIVEYLIDQGANKEAKNLNGDSPLHYASHNNHIQIVDYLISQSVNKDPINNKQQTPFMIATKEIQQKYFIDELKYPQNFEKDIFKAVIANKLNSVEYLHSIVKIDINIKNMKNQTLLHMASKYGNLDIAKYLISNGTNIEEKDVNGETALHLACRYNHLQIVEYLISQGANKDPINNKQETPFIFAKMKNHSQIINYFIYKFKYPSKLEKDIFKACRRDDLESVKYLIDKLNIDPNMKYQEDKTLLHISTISGHLPNVKYLISKGANIEEKDKRGKTALDYAYERGSNSIIEYLTSQGAHVHSKYKDNVISNYSKKFLFSIRKIQYKHIKSMDSFLFPILLLLIFSSSVFFNNYDNEECYRSITNQTINGNVNCSNSSINYLKSLSGVQQIKWRELTYDTISDYFANVLFKRIKQKLKMGLDFGCSFLKNSLNFLQNDEDIECIKNNPDFSKIRPQYSQWPEIRKLKFKRSIVF